MLQGAANLAGESIGAPIAQKLFGPKVDIGAQPSAYKTVPIQGHRRMSAGFKDMVGRPAQGYGSHVTNLNAEVTHNASPVAKALIGGQNILAHAPGAYTALRPGAALNFGQPGRFATGAAGRALRLPQVHARAAAPFSTNALMSNRVGRGMLGAATNPWVTRAAPLAGRGATVAKGVGGMMALEPAIEAASGRGLNESPSDVYLRNMQDAKTPELQDQAYYAGEDQLGRQFQDGRMTPAQHAQRLGQLQGMASPGQAQPNQQSNQPPSASLPVSPFVNPGGLSQQPQAPAPQQPGQPQAPPNLFSMDGVKHLGRVFQNLSPMQQAALLGGGAAALYGGGQALSGNGGLGSGIMGLLGLGAGAYGLHGLMKGWNGDGIQPQAPGANPGGVSNPVDPNAALGSQAGNLQPETIKAIVETLADPNMPPSRAQQIVKALPQAQRQQAQTLLKAYMGNDYKTIADLYPDAMPPGVQSAYEYLPDDWVNAGIGMTGIPDSRAAEYGITRENAPQLDALLSPSGGGGFGA